MQVGDPGTIAIVTDATADVPVVERAASRTGRISVEWVVVPEVWRTEHEQEFRDDGSANRALVELVLGDSPSEPSEPGWDDFVAAYGRLREVDRVFSIHPPANVSDAVERAREAAGAFPNVRVVEATVTGIGLGLLAVAARDLAANGACPDEVEDWLRSHREAVRMLVVPDRFNPATTQRRLSARLLAGSPMLHGTSAGDGLDRSHRLRSRRATVAAIERYYTDHTTDQATIRLAVGHGDAAGAIDPLLDLLERIRPGAEVVLVGRVGPRLVQQVGSRCVAAAWLEEAAVTKPEG